MQPADFTYGIRKRVWLRCPGCMHGCGRTHVREATVYNLTRSGGRIVCSYCESRGGKSCPCQSVAADPGLLAEWHPDNPPAKQVARNCNGKFLWNCLKGHKPYWAACRNRCSGNTGCPVCVKESKKKKDHPSVSVGRPDLAEEWDVERNEKSPDEVTLGSNHMVFWRCRNNPGHTWQAMVYSRALIGTGCPNPKCKKANRSKPRIFGSVQQSG